MITTTSELVRLYYHYDGRTNVARLTAAAQTVVESYETDPFGKLTIKDKNGSPVSATQVGNPYTFQRRALDGETGLYYFRARMYDPNTGHWLQRDPLGLEPGPNWHEFCRSAPTTLTDPLGEDPAGADKATMEAIEAVVSAIAPGLGWFFVEALYQREVYHWRIRMWMWRICVTEIAAELALGGQEEAAANLAETPPPDPPEPPDGHEDKGEEKRYSIRDPDAGPQDPEYWVYYFSEDLPLAQAFK